jgi:poly-gamma-glutamate synthesis protein (capsule biosynthesis protein)
MRVVAGVGVLLLLLTACSTPSESEPALQPSPSPTTSSSAPPPSPTTEEPDPPTTEPLVIAVHVRRPPADLTRRQAGLLLDGGVTRWSQLGLPGGRLTVTRNASALRTLATDTVAVVPASKVGPEVRVLSVEGVHPLRDPDDYPIRAAGPDPGAVTTLTVVGDIMLGRRVGERAAAEGDPSYPLRPMQRRLRSADITVGNLESTISTNGSPTQGGDSFAADFRVVRGLREAGFDALSMGNNHAGDYGPVALVETFDGLAGFDLVPFGAGRDLAEARRPAIVKRHGVSFGFIGFNAIGETPEAGPRTPGANSLSMPPRTGPLDRSELDRVLADVRRLAQRVDLVTVMPHWGEQYTERPWPIQEYVARQLVRAGADLVVGGHPHWVQGATLVGHSLVVQSLGNFAFDMTTPETNEGLVLEATYWGDELKGVDFVPYRIGADHAPRVVPYDAAERMFGNFWRFSALGATTPR